MERNQDASNIIDQTQNLYKGAPIFNPSSYDDRVIGWNAVDEPGSVENYACMRKIDQLMNTASGGKRRLYFSNAGIFNGWVGRNILAHKYQLSRTGDIPLPTLQNYIVEHPYQSIDSTHIQPGLVYHTVISEVNLWNVLHFINNIERQTDSFECKRVPEISKIYWSSGACIIQIVKISRRSETGIGCTNFTINYKFWPANGV